MTAFAFNKLNLCFLADSKSRVQELSNDVSFVIFGHKTWDLEGGGQNSKNRVKISSLTTG